MAYERPIFEQGKRYRVKRTFTSALTTFSGDEVLVFQRHFYSRYDSSFVYEFRTENDGKIKDWWLHEDKSIDTWKEFFEAVPDSN